MIQIGEIEIHLINDARVWVDYGGVFGLVPPVLWSRYMTPDAQNRLPMDHHCLLVRAAGQTIVVETGIGTKLDPKISAFLSVERPSGGLVAGLAAHGVRPEEVDVVINTHLHSDHCGGNTYYDEDRQLRPTFPNAEYRVQRLEYADAILPNERTRGTYFPENFKLLYESGQLCLLDGPHEVVPGMRCVVTPGHTRAHQSIVFESGGQSALYVADLATMSVHFARLGWMTAYDVEPLVTLETKRVWQQWALERDALLVFVHEPNIPVGRLVEKEPGKLEVIPTDGSARS